MLMAINLKLHGIWVLTVPHCEPNSVTTNYFKSNNDKVLIALQHLKKVEAEISRRKSLGMDCTIAINTKASIEAFIKSDKFPYTARLDKAQLAFP